MGDECTLVVGAGARRRAGTLAPQALHQGSYRFVRQQLPGAPLSNNTPGSVHNEFGGLSQNVCALFLCCGEFDV